MSIFVKNPQAILHISLLAISTVLLSSCVVYRNNSRDLFERNAPSRIVNSNIGSTSIVIHQCWTQEESMALPELPENKFPDQFFYTRQDNIDRHTIEVCIAENIPDSHAPVLE